MTSFQERVSTIRVEDEAGRTQALEVLRATYRDEKGWVKAIKCIRMQLGEPDAKGRRKPVPIKGSWFDLPVDLLEKVVNCEYAARQAAQAYADRPR